MSLSFEVPEKLKFSSKYEFLKKETSIILTEYFFTKMPKEVKENIEKTAQAVSVVESCTNWINDLAMTLCNMYVLGFSISLLFGFSKFLKLNFPLNLQTSFQNQMKNIYK